MIYFPQLPTIIACDLHPALGVGVYSFINGIEPPQTDNGEGGLNNSKALDLIFEVVAKIVAKVVAKAVDTTNKSNGKLANMEAIEVDSIDAIEVASMEANESYLRKQSRVGN